MAHTEAPWLDFANADKGVHEVKGKKHNDRILEMLREIGHPEVQNDEDSWCATALGSWLVRSGYPTSSPLKLNRTGMSYEDYGKPCEPCVGAISVSTYTKLGKKDWRRHVGIITEVADGKIKVLGGNTGDEVKEAWVPLSKVTATRWPTKAEEKPEPVKPIVKTAVKSKSVWAQFTAIILTAVSYLTSWIGDAWHWVADIITSFPALVGAAGGTITSAREALSWVDVPWSKVGFGVVIASMSVVLVRHIQDKRRVPWD